MPCEPRSFWWAVHLLCPAMGWNVMCLRCDWLWGHVVWFEVVLWRCGNPKNYLQSATPVLLCTTKYYCSTTLHNKYYSLLFTTPVLHQYYKVLLQFYSVLQSTTPQCKVLQHTTSVLLCTTLYYKLLLQYYSVLQSTTPVLLCTKSTTSVLQSTSPVQPCTKVLLQYYSGTILYYKVPLQYFKVPLQYYCVCYSILLQYYSVLQSTTPVLLCTTKYYCSTTQYRIVLRPGSFVCPRV